MTIVQSLSLGRELNGPLFITAEAAIEKFRVAHGETAFRTARTSGQYQHPTGMFFGGFGPTFARQTLERIALDYAVKLRRFVLVDTGLGPYGYGELQCEQASGMSGYERAVEIFGLSVTSPDLAPHRLSSFTAPRMIFGRGSLVIDMSTFAWSLEPMLRSQAEQHCVLTTGCTHMGKQNLKQI